MATIRHRISNSRDGRRGGAFLTDTGGFRSLCYDHIFPWLYVCVCSCMHKNLSTCCTGGGCYQLQQLALVVLLHSATCAKTALALGQLALCGGMLIYSICTDI